MEAANDKKKVRVEGKKATLEVKAERNGEMYVCEFILCN